MAKPLDTIEQMWYTVHRENEERENMTVKKWTDQLNAEHDRLRPLYDEMTADQTGHWKEPFTAVVPADKFDDYSAAAVYFLGSGLTIVDKHTLVTKKSGLINKLTVHCQGYHPDCA